MVFEWGYVLLVVVVIYLIVSVLATPYLLFRVGRWNWWEGILTGRNRSWYVVKGREIWQYLRMGKEDRVGRYRELGDRKVRLLKILPGNDTNQVACILHEASLDDATITYEALSYTWGSPVRSSTIILDSKQCHVTAHLERALRRLRHLSSNRIVWVDSLCIDQSSFEERSRQVKFMAEIYEKASQVVVWLGEGGHRREDAVEFLLEAGRQSNLEAWLKHTIGQLEHSDSWKAITQLLAEDYWTRVWIIQEIAKASRLAILYGPYTIEWVSLVACQRVWAEERWKEGRPPALENWFSNVEQTFYPPKQVGENHFRPWVNELYSRIEYQVYLRSLGAVVGPLVLEELRIQLQNNSSAPSLELLNILNIHWYSLATNNLDKIFALIGLSTVSKTAEHLIDYSQSEPEAYANLITFLLSSTQKIDVICFSGTLSHIRGFPSWMPYWGDNDTSWTSAKTGYLKFNDDAILPTSSDPAHDLPRIVAKHSFSACANVPGNSEVTIRVNRRIFSPPQNLYFLRTEGCCIDKISHIVWTYNMQHPALSHHGYPGFQYGDKTGFRDGTKSSLQNLLKRFRRHSNKIEDLGLERTVPREAMPTMITRACNIAENPETLRLIQDVKLIFRLAIETSQPSLRYPGQLADLDERRESIWRTLIFNRTAEGELPPENWGHVFDVLVNDGIGVPDDFMASSNPRLTPLERARAYVLPYVAAVKRTLKGRCIFITEKGRFGLGTYYAQRGDWICVLFGCSVPVLIAAESRAKNSERLGEMPILEGIFHGAVFFPGYMEGRAIQEYDAGVLTRRVFSLS